MDEEDRYTRITLRIPKELHRSLSEASEKTSKSLNAEIVGRLAASFQPRENGASDGAPTAALLLDQLQAQLDAQSQAERARTLKFELAWMQSREALLNSELAQSRHKMADLEEALERAEHGEDSVKAKRLLMRLEEERSRSISLVEDLESLQQGQRERTEELRRL